VDDPRQGQTADSNGQAHIRLGRTDSDWMERQLIWMDKMERQQRQADSRLEYTGRQPICEQTSDWDGQTAIGRDQDSSFGLTSRQPIWMIWMDNKTADLDG
jgi:hypothetical protein